MIEIQTERDRIRTVAQRWDEEWKRLGCFNEPEKIRISRLLHALDVETATAEDVKRITGRDTWAGIVGCTACGNDSSIVAIVGEPPDYDSSTAWLCPDCVAKTFALVQAAKERV